MASWNRDPQSRPGQFATNDETMAGSPAVAAFFNAVYGWMAAGLGVTALVAWEVAEHIDSFRSLLSGGSLLVLVLLELGLVVAISSAVQKINANVATVLFLVYSALNGVLLSGLFLAYAHVTLASTFMVTALSFGAVSLYGMATHRDLTRMGNLMFMALFGLILATVVNMFFASSGLYWLVNYAGVIIFVGLSAYDTQRLKSLAVQTSGDSAMAARYSVVGALMLYLDFLNLFLFLLRILGDNGRQR